MSLDREQGLEKLVAYKDQYDRPAEDARIDLENRQILPEKTGFGIHVYESLALIEESEPITSSPWLWVGVAAGAALVAGGIALAVTNPFQTESICITSASGPGCR